VLSIIVIDATVEASRWGGWTEGLVVLSRLWAKW